MNSLEGRHDIKGKEKEVNRHCLFIHSVGACVENLPGLLKACHVAGTVQGSMVEVLIRTDGGGA